MNHAGRSRSGHLLSCPQKKHAFAIIGPKGGQPQKSLAVASRTNDEVMAAELEAKYHSMPLERLGGLGLFKAVLGLIFDP